MMHNEKSIKNFIDEMINTKEEEFIIEDNYIGNYSFDITFCIDTSGSMIKYYDNVLELINILFKKSLKFLSNENINVKFGCVIYRDHFPQEKEYVTKSFQLCDSKKIIEILKNIKCGGGGDNPEAVFDGLNESLEIKWRENSRKFIIHIADAPPHGKNFHIENKKEPWLESFDWPDGCPCGLNLDEISNKLNRAKISYRLIKIGNSLEKMAEIFKNNFEDFRELEIENKKIIDILIKDIFCDKIKY